MARALLVLACLEVTVVQFAMLLFMDYRTVLGCPCPRNLLFRFDNPAVHQGLMTAQRVVGATPNVPSPTGCSAPGGSSPPRRRSS